MTGSSCRCSCGSNIPWKPPAQLLEWGCALMRGAPAATPIEHTWQMAAVAGRAQDYECGYFVESGRAASLTPALRRAQSPRESEATRVAAAWRSSRQHPNHGGHLPAPRSGANRRAVNQLDDEDAALPPATQRQPDMDVEDLDVGDEPDLLRESACGRKPAAERSRRRRPRQRARGN